MKPFNGPRRQGGWIGLAAAVVGAYASSRSQSAANKDKDKMSYESQRDLSNLDFQQRQWLQEQARAWQLQDKQFDLNYKENAIGSFRDAAPPNAVGDNGAWGAPPAPTQIDTSNLARTQENGQAAIVDPRTGQPVNANAVPLSQFGGGMADNMQQPMPEQAPGQGSAPDGGDPSQMVGYIPEEYPAKLKTYLAAARKVYLRDETAAMIRKMLGAANEPAHALALFVGKLIDSLETRLGPLTDDEHDKVALIICGWLASTMQAMGMPGMDSPEGRQDFMGRILTQLDSMQQEAPQEGAEDAQQAPMGQFQPQAGVARRCPVSGDIWAAIAGGANYIGQQQKDAQDEERWQQRYEFMRQQQMEDEKAKQRFLMSIRPPETRKVNTTDTAGKPIVRTEEWRLNGDQGAWANIGETPDVNFERLQETARHNQESEQLRSDANQARAEAATARLGLERERLENAKGRSGGAGRLIRQVMPDGSAVYGTVKDGKFSPVTDEEGNPLNTTAWRPRQGKPGEGDAIGPPQGKVQPVFVDPSAQRPMSQFQPKAKPQAAPAPAPGGQHGKVVRTGTKNGRRVVMYEDGTIEEQ